MTAPSGRAYQRSHKEKKEINSVSERRALDERPWRETAVFAERPYYIVTCPPWVRAYTVIIITLSSSSRWRQISGRELQTRGEKNEKKCLHPSRRHVSTRPGVHGDYRGPTHILRRQGRTPLKTHKMYTHAQLYVNRI